MMKWLKRLFRSNKDVDIVPDIPADNQLPEKFRCLMLTPPLSGRVETGVVMFGKDDWPGVFIRGDYAAQLAPALRATLKAHQRKIDDLDLLHLINLMELLESSNVRGLPIEPYTPAPVVANK